MNHLEKVVSALGIFASDVRACDRTGTVTGAHFTIADRNWTLSVQWNSGSYSGIGRGHDPADEDYETFEAALWDNGIDEGNGCANWIPMTPDRDLGFGVEPMAWATLAEIEAAMLRLLIEGPPVRVVSDEETEETEDAETIARRLVGTVIVGFDEAQADRDAALDDLF